jgi:omega-6 fatty acid desaturase (delta-12 desaturase)
MSLPETTKSFAVDEQALITGIRAYQNAARWRSIWQLVNSVVPYLALWGLAWWVLQYSFWLTLPFTVVAGGFAVRLFIIFHDCGHASFFRSKRANHFWGVVMGVLTFTPYYYWTRQHALHHATSGNLDKRGHGDIWTMTVDEYRQASRFTRLRYRLYRNPVVLLMLGPVFLLLIVHRFARHGATWKDRLSVYGTNAALAVTIWAVVAAIGWSGYLAIQLPILFVALSSGVWLFYVQHQFEDVYWTRQDDWDILSTAIHGSSFYKLPAVLNWFTGSIGYHHVHHANPRVPNYNLAACHRQIPALQTIEPIGFWRSLKSLTFRLYDERENRLVGFGHLKRGYPAVETRSA